MKKLFTLAAAVLASVSMWAETANLTATSGVNFAEKGYTWPDLAKNKVLYDATTNPQFMAWSNGNALAFDESNGMKIGNSSKKSAVVFRIANASDISINIGRNGSDAKVTLYYLGASTDVLTDPHTSEVSGTKCAEEDLSASSATAELKCENAAAGYYEILGSLRFCVKDITISAATAADHSKATVKSISVDGVKLADFDAEKLEYGIELDYGTTIVPTVTAVAGDDATILVTPAESLPGTTTVKCTSYDESATVTYNINFTVSETASNDATLKSLSVAGTALAGFAADKYEYDVEVEYDATAAPTVTAEVNESHATAVVTPAETIPGATTVVVTAQDGTTKLTYTINFAKETEIPIIRANHVNGTTADVKGTIGGTYDKLTQDDGKLGSKGHHFGITLADDNTFKTGDSLVVNLSQTPGKNSIALYADADGTTLLYDTKNAGVVGNNSFILPEALNGKATFYIARPKDGETNQWNGFIKSISVYRKESGGGGATAIDNIEAGQVVKTIENGQLVIIKNGIRYNAQGSIVR